MDIKTVKHKEVYIINVSSFTMHSRNRRLNRLNHETPAWSELQVHQCKGFNPNNHTMVYGKVGSECF